MNQILRSKDMSELKDLPKKLMQIGTTCQRYNIGKVYFSSILPSRRTSFNIGEINEVFITDVIELCHKDNFVFLDHQNVTSDNLWVDGIYLTISVKALLARDFAEKINEFRILIFRGILSSRFYKSSR